MRHTSPNKPGFSLVELVVIAPLAILLIGALILAAIQISTTSLRSYARSQLQYDILSALDSIEQDVSLSTSIDSSSTSQLTMDSLATNTNPFDPNRKLVQLSDCQPANTGITTEDATTFLRTYRIVDGSLERNANFTGRWCGGSQSAQGSRAWQRHNTPETLIRDANVSMNLTYHGDDPVDGVTVELSGSKMVSGQSINYTGRLHVQSNNIH